MTEHLRKSVERDRRRPAMPQSIWALGFVSMFMDVSSEMIHSLLPVFLVAVLGAGATTVGLIEGIGEATASITKVFSGWLSDRLGRRKALTGIGYGLAAVSKPLFAIAPTASWVLLARFSDRIGKGIRGAPRDALIGDLAPPEVRGAAFGLRQSLDTVGAFAGPTLALLLMELSGYNFRLVFWLALIPGLVAVAILVLGVSEPARGRPRSETPTPIRWAEMSRFGALFWGVVGVGAILTLARFSEAFLVLRAVGVGLPIALAPLVLIVMNIIYALSAYPMGALSDRCNRGSILRIGFGILIVADLVLAFAGEIATVMIGIGLWGLHMGMTQGLLSTLVADATASELRGSAFGLFNLACGAALLLASFIAGILWQEVGPFATFAVGAALTSAGLLASAILTVRGPA